MQNRSRRILRDYIHTNHKVQNINNVGILSEIISSVEDADLMWCSRPSADEAGGDSGAGGG